MDIETRTSANGVVVTLTGRLDAVTAPDFQQRLLALIDGGVTNLVVDFGQLAYISSAGLRGLLIIAKRLKVTEGRMRFANVQGAIHDVFEISGFGTLFPMDASVELALAALA